jgi:hypothetical protein
MAKTPADLKAVIDAFVIALNEKLSVERIILWGDYAAGTPSGDSDIRLVVISPSFKERERTSRMNELAQIAARIDTHIQAWGYTPDELAGAFEGPLYSPILSMILQDATEVYPKRLKASRKVGQRNA